MDQNCFGHHRRQPLYIRLKSGSTYGKEGIQSGGVLDLKIVWPMQCRDQPS